MFLQDVHTLQIGTHNAHWCRERDLSNRVDTDPVFSAQFGIWWCSAGVWNVISDDADETPPGQRSTQRVGQSKKVPVRAGSTRGNYAGPDAGPSGPLARGQEDPPSGSFLAGGRPSGWAKG